MDLSKYVASGIPPSGSGGPTNEYYTDPATGMRYFPVYSGGGVDSNGDYTQGTLVGYNAGNVNDGNVNGAPRYAYDVNGNQTQQWSNERLDKLGLDEKLISAAVLGMAGAGAYGAAAGGGTAAGVGAGEAVSGAYLTGAESAALAGGGTAAGGGLAAGGGVAAGGGGIGAGTAGGGLLSSLGGAGSLIGPAASLASGALGAAASGKAANAQVQSAQEANRLQERMWLKNLELNEPFRQAGVSGLNRLQELTGTGGNPNSPDYGMTQREFSPADFLAGRDPGYQFRMDEGLKAVEAGAAARGGLYSGAGMKDLVKYGQNVASDEWGKSFDRYGVNQQRKLNPLQSLAGMGQTTSANLGQAGQNYGAQAGQNITGAGNARASGYVGGANAIAGGVAGAYNGYQQNRMLDAFMPRSSGYQAPSYAAPVYRPPASYQPDDYGSYF